MAGVEARHYRAFISYSHKDGAAGTKLFKRLDGYRPPKALRGRQTAFGPVPDKLHPIFRDREELATSPDLSAGIQAALAASDHLVIVCSPHAAASKWVNAEVETFRQLGKADRIHAVLVDGEPAAAFPPALTDAGIEEPVAADLRAQGDGWSDGPLKVISGILGLGFGELKDREVARARARARLNAAVAGLFALLAVFAGISAWRAIEQTRRAETELTRAEAAILTAVEGVASIVDQVATGSETGTIPTPVAARLLATADGLIAGVVALAPDNPRLLEEQGKVLILFARHYRAVGDVAAASRAAVRARDLYAKLESRDDRGISTARLRSAALDERGASLMAAGDRDGALTAYEESLKIRRQLANADPGKVGRARDISVSLNRIGNVRAAAGNRDGALAAYEESLKISRQLADADPENTDLARDVSVGLGKLGNLRLAAGDRDGALATYEESLEIARHLATADPQNIGWARDVSVGLNKLGDVRLAAGDRDGALAAYGESLEISRHLIEADPGNTEWIRDVAVSLGRIGEVKLGGGDRDGALTAYGGKPPDRSTTG